MNFSFKLPGQVRLIYLCIFLVFFLFSLFFLNRQGKGTTLIEVDKVSETLYEIGGNVSTIYLITNWASGNAYTDICTDEESTVLKS